MSKVTPSRSSGLAGRPPLGYLLRQAAATHRLVMERLLAGVDVTPPQFLVMRLLQAHPGSSNADLARLAMLSTPTVTVIVANLSRRDLVTSRAHATHGRVRHLDLTHGGAELLQACKERAARAEAGLEEGLTPAEAATIAQWLVRASQPAG